VCCVGYKKIELLNYVRQIYVDFSRSCCIRYCNFNVNNVFKFILFPSSLKVYYNTDDSGLHSFKLHEYCSIFGFKLYRMKFLSS